MTIVSNTYQTYDTKGIKESYEDVIFNISPTETPFFASTERTKVTNPIHQWLTDALANASTSGQIEGDQYSYEAVTAPTRVQNVCMIQTRRRLITGTQEVVAKYGRSSEVSYQLMKCMEELARDAESALLNNVANNNGATNTARVTAGFPAWITSNDSATGADGGYNSGTGNVTARTDGTQRDLTEDLLKVTLGNIWNSGGKANIVYANKTAKIRISGFTGNATRYMDASEGILMSAIDFYDSDWGRLQIVPNRFMRARDLLVVDPSKVAVGQLRPFMQDKPGKNGDATPIVALHEFCLVMKNEAAHGGVFDLNT